MRLYLYIDKELLRRLFSVEDDGRFDIEVIEYSVRKSNSTTNSIALNPCFEEIKECENEKYKEKEEKCRKKTSSFGKDKLSTGFDHSNTYNIQTEKRYINIEDITNMKNTNFYHKLIEKLREKEHSIKDARICQEVGFANIYNFCREESSKSKFLIMNNSLIWLDLDNLQGDIDILTKINCRLNIIGYRMDCMEQDSKKIIKAIAIYIE